MTFVHHYTHVWRIIPGVGGCGEVLYVLICHPAPGGFLTGVMGGAKPLLIDLMKQSGKHVVIHQRVFAGHA